jgi:hypothetical protein
MPLWEVEINKNMPTYELRWLMVRNNRLKNCLLVFQVLPKKLFLAVSIILSGSLCNARTMFDMKNDTDYGHPSFPC